MVEEIQTMKFNGLSSEKLVALKTLEEKLISPSVCTLPCEGYFTVDTDAWDKQIGCVVLYDEEEGPAKSI